MINPYENLNWSTSNKVVGTTHDHCTDNDDLTKLHNGGVECLTISNYRPSQPWYLYSDFFTIDIGNVIEAPNAEQHNLGGLRANGANLGASAHFNSVGSTFSSGSPEGEEPVGCGGIGWQTVFDSISSTMLYTNGGGITINHPNWSIGQGSVDLDTYKMMMDYSPLVLGVEFYNQTCERLNNTGWAIDIWDNILNTGRRCWGFAVPDHDCQDTSGITSPDWKGRIIYLVDTLTQESCLQALRNGCFYSRINDTDLEFDSITFDKSQHAISCEASNAEYFVVVENGKSHQFSGTSINYKIPYNSKYVRVEAHNSTDSIYSNPIMLDSNDNTGENIVLFF